MSNKKLYTREQARAIDQEIISGGIPGYALMSQAGDAAANIALKHWPKAQRFTIFCGLGNNAGDGYIVARLLKQQNKTVQVVQIGSIEKLQGDALIAYKDALDTGIYPISWSTDLDFTADLYVDALLGTGLNSELKGQFLSVVEYLNQRNTPILAIDIPTGLDANTGTPLGDAVRANLTVTFIVYKQGLFTKGAKDYCGEIILAPLVDSNRFKF